MKFAQLAKYLEKLEGTASRIEMTKILARLFSEATPEEARLIAYMTAGRLGPAYNSPDTGVADKMMLKALGEGVEKVFKETGDLGKTVERLKSLSHKVIKQLSISEVYGKLGEIAGAGGEGSQELKVKLIGELVNRLTGREAKYAVKMVLGKLRTGFSDMTVLDSLSWMVTGDKSLRSEIEDMYNVRADLGEIAEEIVKHKKPKKLIPTTGVPILMAKAERATTADQIWERNGRCAVEYKLDGLRIQAHITKKNVKLFSRGLEDMATMFPEVVSGLKERVNKECVIEGEVIAVGKDGNFLPFQETMQRKRKYNIEEMSGKIPLTIYLFDVLVEDGKPVMLLQNQERRKILEGLVKEGDGVRLMPRIIAKDVGEIEVFFVRALKAGTEGIIAKKLEGPYQPGGRDFNWIKYKKSYDKSALSDTIDAVVMGYDAGQGKRAGFGIGDFLIGVYEAKTEKFFTVAKVGTGLTDEEWKEMKLQVDKCNSHIKPQEYEVNKIMNVDVWAKPNIVVEIQADEITKSPMHSSGLALRFPRLIGWREKKPVDATSLQEIKIMFKMQKEGNATEDGDSK